MPKVVCVGGLPSAYDARLARNKPQMLLAADTLRLTDCKDAFVDPRSSWSTCFLNCRRILLDMICITRAWRRQFDGAALEMFDELSSEA